MDVNPSDSSYMPQRITVQGGVAADHVEDLSTVRQCSSVASAKHFQFQSPQVYIPSTFLGEFELLKNCKKHYPVIVLRIKRSQQVSHTRTHARTHAHTHTHTHRESCETENFCEFHRLYEIAESGIWFSTAIHTGQVIYTFMHKSFT